MSYLDVMKTKASHRKALTEDMAHEIVAIHGIDHSYVVDAVTKLTNGSTLVAYQTVNRKSQLHSRNPIKPDYRVICFRANGAPTFNMMAG